jgi:hypothetical protein
METRPRRQQTTEKIGDPLDLGLGKVYIERRNNSPDLSARTFIQGKPKVWTTGERDEKKARAAATLQFFDLHRRIADVTRRACQRHNAARHTCKKRNHAEGLHVPEAGVEARP